MISQLELGNFTASLVSLASLTSLAHGAITIDISEVGGKVIATYSGSLDLTGNSLSDSASLPPGIQAIVPGRSSFALGTAPDYDVYLIRGTDPITSFGSGSSPIYADSSTGDFFMCNVADGSMFYYIFVAGNYVSGSTIAGSSTWNDTTISAMGLIPDSTHDFRLPHDAFTVNIGSSIPEPSTAALLGLGTAAGFFFRHRAN